MEWASETCEEKKLVELCHTNNLIIGNKWFQQSTRTKWTCKGPGDGNRNHIDYILVNKRLKNALLSANTDCRSD